MEEKNQKLEAIDSILEKTLADSRVVKTTDALSYFGLNKNHPCYYGMSDRIKRYEKILGLNQKEYLAIHLLRSVLIKCNDPLSESKIFSFCEKPIQPQKENFESESDYIDEKNNYNTISDKFSDIFKSAAAKENFDKYIKLIPHGDKIGLRNSKTKKPEFERYCRFFHYAFSLSISFDPYTQQEIEKEKYEKEQLLEWLIHKSNRLAYYYDEEELHTSQIYILNFINDSNKFIDNYYELINRDTRIENELHQLTLIIDNYKMLVNDLQEEYDFLRSRGAELQVLINIAEKIQQKISWTEMKNEEEKEKLEKKIRKEIERNYEFYIKFHEKPFWGITLPTEKEDSDYFTYIWELVYNYIDGKFEFDSTFIEYQTECLVKEINEGIKKYKIDTINCLLYESKEKIKAILVPKKKLKQYSSTSAPIINFLSKMKKLISASYEFQSEYSNKFSQKDEFQAEYYLSKFVYEKVYGVNLTKSIIDKINKSNNSNEAKNVFCQAIMIPDIFSREVYLNILSDLFDLRTYKSYYSIDHSPLQNEVADNYFSNENTIVISEENWLEDCQKYFSHLAFNYYPIIEEISQKYFYEEIGPIDKKRDILDLVAYIDYIEKERKQYQQDIFVTNDNDFYENIFTILAKPTFSNQINLIYRNYYQIFFNSTSCESFEKMLHNNYMDSDELKEIADKAVQWYKRNYLSIHNRISLGEDSKLDNSIPNIDEIEFQALISQFFES